MHIKFTVYLSTVEEKDLPGYRCRNEKTPLVFWTWIKKLNPTTKNSILDIRIRSASKES